MKKLKLITTKATALSIEEILAGTIRTAIVILANELGYYKEEGVDVDSIQLVEVDSQR